MRRPSSGNREGAQDAIRFTRKLRGVLKTEYNSEKKKKKTKKQVTQINKIDIKMDCTFKEVVSWQLMLLSESELPLKLFVVFSLYLSSSSFLCLPLFLSRCLSLSLTHRHNTCIHRLRVLTELLGGRHITRGFTFLGQVSSSRAEQFDVFPNQVVMSLNAWSSTKRWSSLRMLTVPLCRRNLTMKTTDHLVELFAAWSDVRVGLVSLHCENGKEFQWT